MINLRPEALFSCKGQVAVITGGATGIGRVCAEALGAAGAQVVIIGPSDTHPSQVAEELASHGGTFEGAVCDVTNDAQLQDVITDVIAKFGRIDTVLANAGVALDPPGGTTLEQLAAMDRMYQIHTRSVVHLAELVLPTMAQIGGGSMMVMSSLAGLRGNRVLSGYGVTKAANAQIARNLAVQWGHKQIRVNALSPGVISTEFARPITTDIETASVRLAKTPLGRFGAPHEVAGAVVWLASPAGAFVSGQNIVIDGGTLVMD